MTLQSIKGKLWHLVTLFNKFVFVVCLVSVFLSFECEFDHCNPSFCIFIVSSIQLTINWLCWQGRIQSYMGRVKEIQDKHLAPRINVDASKRFVRNALWDAAQKLSSPSAVKSMSSVKLLSNYIQIPVIFTSCWSLWPILIKSFSVVNLKRYIWV